VRAFSLPHALYIRQQFSKFLGTSNTYLNLGFGILLLRLILLAFSMLILQVVGLIERALLVHAIFSDLLLFAGLLEKNFQLLNSPEAEYVPAAPRSYGLCTP
jgi:hypothetical protein